MKNIFVALLIFIFVMCFFFIPHGDASQANKIEILLCLDSSTLSSQNDGIVLTAQMPLILSINLNPTYDKDLLCEATYASPNRLTLTKSNTNKPSGLALGITGYKTTKPWKSFHAGK